MSICTDIYSNPSDYVSKYIPIYPETIEQNYLKNYLKLYGQKYYKPKIYLNISTKLELVNLFEYYKYLMDKLKQTNIIIEQINNIVLPEHIIKIIESNIGKKESNNVFIPAKYILNAKNYNNLLINNFNIKMVKNIGFIPELSFNMVMQYACDEIESVLFPNNLNNKFKNEVNNEYYLNFMNNIMNNIIILYSYDYKNILVLNEYFIIILTDDYILIYHKLEFETKSNNFILIIRGKIYFRTSEKKDNNKNNDEIKVCLKINKELIKNETIKTTEITETNNIGYRIIGYATKYNKKLLLNCSIDNKLILKKFYNYTNKNIKMNLKSNYILFYKQKIGISTHIKSNCIFKEYYNYNNGMKHIISQCMDNKNDSSTGLRYRGKYSGTSQNGKNISKTIWSNDKIVYNKEGDEILTNLLVADANCSCRTEMIIGWKIAKSELGELRIIKLGIMPDAQIVIPIDEQYFINYDKERCNKAIVLDIQLPQKNEEISVVPEETVSYSYVYDNSNIKFQYVVGSEVIPDSFNLNEDESCANGIHYFRNRINVFKAFID